VKIPVFVSMPNALSAEQQLSLRKVFGELDKLGLEARTVGQTDYPTEYPLREVYTLARHCSGGVVLGFSQFEATKGIWKKGTPFEKKIEIKNTIYQATPWNQIEAGVLFSLGLPLLVFKEKGIAGGVFDPGVTDLFIHEMPKARSTKKDKDQRRQVFQKWASEVQSHYYLRPVRGR
jgi:hypothetical protein